MSLNYSHLTTLTDNDRQSRLVVGSDGNVLDFSHDQQSVNHAAKDDVLVVQKVTFGAGDEELTAVGVLATVCHGQKTGGVVFQSKVLVWEGVSVVDVYDTRSIVVYKVSALYHKVFNNSVKTARFVPGSNKDY